MHMPADCSVIATIKMLSNLTDLDPETTKEMVYRNMGEDWYKNTRKGGPGIDLTLLYVNLLDLFESLYLDDTFEIVLRQINGDRASDFYRFNLDRQNPANFLIVNFDEADITQDDEDGGHFEFVEYNTDGDLCLNGVAVNPVTLFNSMRSKDPTTDEARGYILIREKGI